MPSYPKFPRSNVAGQIPQSMNPGSFATNWADGKLFVGGPSGAAQLVGFPLRDFRNTSSYRAGDAVIYENKVWRCETSFLAPGSFNPADWTDLTAGSIDPAHDLASSVLLSGGGITAPGGVVTVAPGTGVQMNIANPDDPIAILVSWPERTSAGPFTSNATIVASITGAGALIFTRAEDYVGTVQRTTIRVGAFTTDDLGAVVALRAAPRAAYQTADTLTDLLRAIGPFKVSGLGLLLSGVSELQIAPGEAFWVAANWQDDESDPNAVRIAATQALTVRHASRLGYVETAPQAEIDPAQWDNSGVMQAVPAGRYTTQFIFIDPAGAGTAVYGQSTYASLGGAEDAVFSDWQSLELPDVCIGMLLIGCVISRADGGDQLVKDASLGPGQPFAGGGSGGGELSAYLLIDGTRPMEGNLDLGANRLVNGVVRGDENEIVPRVLTPTGNKPGVLDDDLSVNIIDRKIYVGDDLVSHKVENFSAARAYAAGDLVINTAALYRAVTPTISPGPFNPANWEVIGGNDPASSLVKAPTNATRNRVDLGSGGGTAKAISVLFYGSQSGDVADFGPRATINRFGVPEKAFGGAVFVVSQATHGYTRIGTPLYFNGLNWVLADTTDPSRFPNAVIAEILDANNFTVQIAGRISNLNTAAFVGGIITPGTYYYASATPGLLTSVPGATPVPVLYTISATDALVKLTGTVIPSVITMADVVNTLYPVGSLYITTDPANPSTRFAGTTWVAHAAGRALVGVGTADGTSWAVNEQKGNSTVTLTEANLPPHAHAGSVSVSGSAGLVSLSGSFDIPRQNVEEEDIITNAGGIVSRSVGSTVNLNKLNNSGAGADRVRVTVDASHSHIVSASGSFTTSPIGSGTPINNIQPSIGVHVWRRTA